MNLIELSERLDRLATIGKLLPSEPPRIMAIANALPPDNLYSNLTRLFAVVDRLAPDRARFPGPQQDMVALAGLVGLARRFEVPVSLVLPPVSAALLQRCAEMLDRAAPGPAVPTIGGSK